MDLVCPNCFHTNMIKEGWENDRQRYGCKRCLRKTIYPLTSDDAEILKENVKLAKQKQSYQDINRIERKTFREYARIENAVGKYNKELVGIFDIDRERSSEISKKFDVKAFDDLNSILEEVDALSIVTNTEYHYKIAEKC